MSYSLNSFYGSIKTIKGDTRSCLDYGTYKVCSHFGRTVWTSFRASEYLMCCVELGCVRRVYIIACFSSVIVYVCPLRSTII